MRLRFYLWALTLTATAVVGAAPAALAAEVDHGDFLRQIAVNQGRPRAETFARASQTQRVAVEALCLDPSPIALAKAQGAYREAFLAWQGLQHLRVGPLEQESRAERIQFWPDDRGAVRRRLDQLLAAADESVATPAGVAKLSVAVQGFPALERLIYGEAPAGTGGYPCRLAAATAGNLAEMAVKIATAWSATAEGAALTGVAEPTQGVQMLAAAWVGQMEVMAGKKLSDPAGADVGSVKAHLTEAPAAGLGGAALRANADALVALTAPGGPLRRAAAAAAAPAGEVAAAKLAAAMAEMRRSLEPLADPLATTLKTSAGRKAAIAATLRIDAARGLLAEVAAASLDVQLGFNSRDGD